MVPKRPGRKKRNPETISEGVKTVVRVRPHNNNKDGKCVRVASETAVVVAKRRMEFDAVLDEDATPDETWATTGALVISKVLDGFNATLMAYGQTGSGKTFSIDFLTSRALKEVFEGDHSVALTYLEVYNEKVRDLLNEANKSLKILMDKPRRGQVPGLTEVAVASLDEARAVLAAGAKRRTVGSTRMNTVSSRSHAILTVNILRNGLCGKLSLVDLAGSERVRKTGAVRFNESKNINHGLLVLGQVIAALAEQQPHVPVRDSKLTCLLSDSLGGTSTTVLIACVAPEIDHSNETFNTLRYAGQARKIQNHPEVNVVPPSSNDMKNEISNLRAQNRHLEEEAARGRDAARALEIANARIRELEASSQQRTIPAEEDSSDSPATSNGTSRNGRPPRSSLKTKTPNEDPWMQYEKRASTLITKAKKLEHFLSTLKHHKIRPIGHKDELRVASDTLAKIKTELRAILHELDGLNTNGVRQTDEESIDVENLSCAICGEFHTDDENNMAFCDRKICRRNFHFKCCNPVLTKKMLGHRDDDWFCHQCVCMLHIVQKIDQAFHTNYEADPDRWVTVFDEPDEAHDLTSSGIDPCGTDSDDDDSDDSDDEDFEPDDDLGFEREDPQSDDDDDSDFSSSEDSSDDSDSSEDSDS